MKLKQFFLVVALVTGLTACGGGSSDSGGSSAATASVSPVNGIYMGDGFERLTGTNTVFEYSLVAIVYEGKVQSLSNSGLTYSSTISAQSSTEYRGLFRAYEAVGDFIETIEVDGSFEQKSNLSGTYTRQDRYEGSFSLDYVPEAYETPANIDLIDGSWNVTNSEASASLTIDSSGQFFGSDADGCVFSGKITVPDPTVNVYQVNLRQENCGDIDGTYNGLASIDTTGQSPILLTIVSNSSFSFPYLLERP